MSKVLSYLVIWLYLIVFSPISWAQNKPNEPKNKNPEQEEIIKVETTLVNIPIVASGKDGQYIRDLKQEDFLVYENGAKQEIELFSTETVPISVVLLIDMSTSTRYNSQALKRAAKAFIENTRPSDKVKLISFTYNINELTDFTDNKEILNQTIDKLNLGGSTRLHDAVEYVARVIFNKVEGRKALIVLTDGVDSSSYLSPQLAIRELVETSTITYVVKYPVDSLPTYPGYLLPVSYVSSKASIINTYNYDKPLDFLKELTEQTGGAIVVAPSFSSLVEKMKNVAEQLRHIYSIGYYPSNAIENGGYRKIEIKLRNRKASLRYKKGYDAHALIDLKQ